LRAGRLRVNLENVPTTARARVRTEITEEIKAIARRHLAEHGADGLSLRAVARELGMVSSAVYRYVPSRDALLTALIIDAFSAVADAAEAADATRPRGDVEGRLVATALGVRAWAREHPHEHALVYGTPVPGYHAPPDTIDPAQRVNLAVLRIVRDGITGGVIDPGRPLRTPPAVAADFAALRATIARDIPDAALSRALLVWTQVLGGISYELFGHLQNGISDYEAFFELQARQGAAYLLHGAAGRPGEPLPDDD
jgi:AcrR family transcriptional regulator